METNINEQESQQELYGDYVEVVGGRAVINVDNTVVSLVMPVSYDKIVSSMVEKRYPKAKMEAIINNYIIGEGDEYMNEMQQWRNRIKAIAHEMIGDVDLDVAKELKIREITQYDNSTAVNEFTFNGNSMWLDDATRTKLAKRFDTDEQDGKTETKLIYGEKTYDLPIQQARAMLHQIESYARDCFDKTNEHKAAVMAKRSINTVRNYDYTVGYPEKLNFDTMFSE